MFEKDNLTLEAQLEAIRRREKSYRVEEGTFLSLVVGVGAPLHLSANSNAWYFLGILAVVGMTTYICYQLLEGKKVS